MIEKDWNHFRVEKIVTCFLDWLDAPAHCRLGHNYGGQKAAFKHATLSKLI